MIVRAVTFDVGQVLLSFDPHALVGKLRERGGEGDAARMEATLPEAWEAYGRAVRGQGARAGWEAFLAAVMRASGATPEPDAALLRWLYEDNARRNLWRRPVPGMIELARALRGAGVRVGVVSNSEGRLAELLDEVGFLQDFLCVADSGKLGHEKPEPPIFRWVFERLEVEAAEVVHIGDSWAADVEGALRVGARAVWFPAADDRPLPAGVRAARSADEVARALAAFGVRAPV